ncbi:MAG: DUF1501 domain-containing protein, partial [Planctomycetes bacterium]|nr:DUF1501 domain-containing protein [Planctomycetota bacterium]
MFRKDVTEDLSWWNTRRGLLKHSALGFGYLALRGICQQSVFGDESLLGPKRPHFAPRAKRIVFLFMKGGPSHIDTFDPKPLLTRDDGKPPPFELPR